MAATLPPEALAAALQAVHKAGGQANSPGSSPTPSTSGQGSVQDPGMDPTQAGGAQDPNSQDPNSQGQDPNEQAVWSEFPSTDPNAVGSLADQMTNADPQDLVNLLGQWMQQAQADQDKLSQMQESLLSHLMDMLGGPAPDGGQGASQPMGQSPVPSGPGVSGGNGTGY